MTECPTCLAGHLQPLVSYDDDLTVVGYQCDNEEECGQVTTVKHSIELRAADLQRKIRERSSV